MELKARYTAGEAIDLMAAILSRVDGDRASLGHPERLALVRSARRLGDRVTGLADVLTVEAEAAGSAEAVAGTQLTTLIGREEHLGNREVLRAVGRARSVARDPEVARGVLDGTVSPEHARGIGRTLDALPKDLDRGQRNRARDFLIGQAGRCTPKQLAEAVDDVLREVAPERVPTQQQADARLARERARALERRSFTFGPDEANPGSWYFTASLPALEAELVAGAIAARVNAAKRAERRQKRRAATPRWDQRQADVLVDLVTDSDDAEAEVGPASPPPAWRGAPRPGVVVTVPYADLEERAAAGGVLPSGQRIPAGELRRILCDADLIPVVLGAQSEILDVGRASRFVTPAIRGALNLRDNGCVFPGCDSTAAECDAHHVVPWWAGGATALHNLVSLCPFHHAKLEPTRASGGAVSSAGWRITIDATTGRPVIVRCVTDGGTGPPGLPDGEPPPLPLTG